MAHETVRLGMVRLTDAAPIVLAKVRGLFAAEGLDVTIAVEPSWANVADKLAWGLLDGGVLLPPLAIAMALGLRGPPTPLVVPAGISLNGNAVTLARRIADPIIAAGPLPADQAAVRLRVVLAGVRARLAVVHAFSTHDLLLRLFLERGGIDPAADVEIVVVPPADMVAALAAGQIDGFCAGAPWGSVAAKQGVGRTIAVTSGVWPNHPEKCLAVHGGWAATHPHAMLALTRAVLRAGVLCDDPAETPALAAVLSAPEWVGVAAPHIAASLPGGAGGDVDRSVFSAHQAGVPNPVHARWFVQQMARWRAMPDGAEAVAVGLYRPDVFERAAADMRRA
jgi:NitT/TauT family transport system ATP-binding protein/nitrate/nitrite transport system substrate-binding protein